MVVAAPEEGVATHVALLYVDGEYEGAVYEQVNWYGYKKFKLICYVFATFFCLFTP